MSIVCGVLEQKLGSDPEGTVIHCSPEMLSALMSAGVAREASEEDMQPVEPDADDKDEQPLDNMEGEDEPQEHSANVARRLAANAADAVQKATDKAVEKIVAENRKYHVPTNRHVAGSDFERTGGFKSLGDATLNFIKSRRGGDRVSTKNYNKWTDHVRNKATAMTIAGSHVGSDLVPQEWADEIYRLAFNTVPDLLGMMTKWEMKTQVINIPSAVQASAASGLVSNVYSENSAISANTQSTNNVQLSLQMGAILVNVSDALLRFQQYNLDTLLKSIVPERMRFMLNDSVINGTFSGVNLVGNGSAVSVVRQTASHIEYQDVTKMLSSLWGDLDNDDAVWLTNPATIPELMSISFPTRASSTPFPAWTPGQFGNLIGPKPKMELLGKRVFSLENCPGIGSRGNLILVNLKNLACGYLPLISDYTNALYFDLADDSFRFLQYFDSVNPLTQAYQRADGSFASNIVVLTAGSTSAS